MYDSSRMIKDDLKKLIRQKKISVAKLARLSDIHQDTIYRFLSGESEMTANKLDKLFLVLKDYGRKRIL